VDDEPATKRCCTCGDVWPLSNFNRRAQSSDGHQARCRDCSRKWYVANKERHIAAAARRKARVRDELRAKLAEYLRSHACVDCGESDIRCLEFDHVDPKTKRQAVSFMVLEVWAWGQIEEEIKKCVVRCANCHRRKEIATRNLWRQRWLLDNGLA
jgi:transcription elongation factor Elf1